MKPLVVAFPLFLASTDAPLPGVESWLRICFWLLAGAGSAVFLYRQLTNKGIATQEDIKQAHGRIARERLELNAELRRVEASAHKRLDDHERRLEEQADRIDSIPERTVKGLLDAMELGRALKK